MPDDMLGDWKTVEEPPPLEATGLHLWRLDLTDATGPEDSYLRRLSSEELARASRLRKGEVRMQFLAARCALRVLLGFHLGIEPDAVQIGFGRYGKPEVLNCADRTLYFNLAHSRSTIVIALSRDSEVGVDLEYVDRETDVDEVAREAFTPAEHRAIAAVDDPILRRRAFFNCWTRKEAIIKADGRGLSLSLPSFEVPVVGPASSWPVEVGDDEASGQAGGRFYVSDIPLGEQMAGAFASRLTQGLAHFFRFPLGRL